ncbi:MAG: 16S rRNA (uracil(1498)-N(3))-methyltransferase [Cellvibrionaceae bacterium]|nr:16S rRNA (uracil(1498)-N(3))-methyltransferase [Cellvibrionaceae bacterium]
MRIPRIYTPQALNPGSEITLEDTAAHHIATVLRSKRGRPVVLFNGLGGEYCANITDISKKKVALTVTSYTDKNTESALTVELGICLIKYDRFDWLIQKATELGVNKITPMVSEFTDIKLPPERVEKKHRHWQEVMINACEQSGRTVLANIEKPTTLTNWLTNTQSECKLVLHPAATNTIGDIKKISGKNTAAIALLIGPEGGLSQTEIQQAQNSQFTPVDLGPRILRAETAPLAALSILQYQYGDLS